MGNLDRLDFTNLTTRSTTNTKVLSSQTVTFTAVINDTTVVSPVLSIHWYSAATTTTSYFSVYQNIQPNFENSGLSFQKNKHLR